MKGHIISNATMAPLAQHLNFSVTLGEYDSLILELIDPQSTSAADPSTTHVLALFDTDALLGEARFDPAAPSRAGDFIEALNSFCSAHPEKAVITHTFCATARRPNTFADTVGSDSVAALEARANARLIELAAIYPNLALFDMELLFRRYGESGLISASFWYAGRIRYTPLMFRELASTITDLIAAHSSATRKVLILDLDNTLWGGVVGESGPLGIALSEEGVGAAYRDFQRALKALKRAGVLLAVCSKNNPGDADEVFEKNPMMILSRDDFACIRVNWDSKPENIAEVAKALNLGLDSIVFIDDSAVEREMVEKAIPEVAVPPFPQKPENLPDWLIDEVVRRYFPRYRLTSEDLRKTEQYRANEARKALAGTFDLGHFIEELNIVCEFDVDDPNSIVRASQMTQKTNQFNLTSLRCDVSEITRYVTDPERSLVALRYTDRFGAEGVVGIAMLDFKANGITNFLLSCRVIGRNVEERLLEKVLAIFEERGAQKVTAEFIPTPKNAIAASFYESHGFSLVEENSNGRKIYERRIDG